MRIIKYTALFCLLAIQTISSQTVINLSAPPTATQNPSIARDRVTMNPGFVYTATSGNSFRAAIDKTVVGDQDYNGSTTEVNNDEQGLAVRELNKNLQVGTVAGGLNVSASGSATYQIPIAVPQGIMGMQPEVSLVYNSQGGDGIMGIGWNLSCTSAISRSGNSIYHDGISSGLLLDADDPLTLDGMRLLCKDNGYKGLAGTNFVTEVANNAKITKQSGGGFIVLTPDGKTLEYGTTDNSRFDVPNGGTISWMLAKVTDANGNFMTYFYQKNTSTGEFYLLSIDYTGNVSQAASNRVQFLYMERTDKWSGYLRDNTINRTVLLEKIELYTDNTLMGSYDLKYSQENSISQLTEGTQTNQEGQSLNPTLFKWSKPKYTAPQAGSCGIYFLESDQIFNGDYNGDGYNDIVVYRKENFNPWGDINKTPVCFKYDWEDRKAYHHKLLFYKGSPNGLLLIPDAFLLPRCGLYYLYSEEYENLAYDMYYAYNDIVNQNGSTCEDNVDIGHIIPFEIETMKEYMKDIFLVSSGDFNGDGVSEIVVGTKELEYDISKCCQIVHAWKDIHQSIGFDKGCYSECNNFNDLFYKANNFNYYFYNINSSDRFQENIPTISSIIEMDDANVDFNQDGKTDFKDSKTDVNTGNKFYSFNLATNSFEFIKEANHGDNIFVKEDKMMPLDYNGDGLIDYADCVNNSIYNKTIDGDFTKTSVPDYCTMGLTDYNNDGTSELVVALANKETRIIHYEDMEDRFNGYIIFSPPSTSIYSTRPLKKFEAFYIQIITSTGRLEHRFVTYNQLFNSDGVIIYPNVTFIKDLYIDYPDQYTVFEITYGYNISLEDKNTYGTSDKNLKVLEYITATTQPFLFFRSCDVNGDGLQDLLKFYSSSLKEIWINKSNLQYDTINVDIGVASNFQLGDFNADGNVELYTGNGAVYKFNQGMPGYHIAEVIDGLNNQTKITYKTLSDATVFEKEASSTPSYPLVSIKAPLYVVNDVKTSTVLKGGSDNEIWSTEKYEYRNLLVHLQGRGFLGFEKFITTSLTTNQRLIQTFEVNTPFYNTTLKKTEVFLGDTELLASTVNTNAVESSQTNSLLFGKQFRPYVSSSVQTDNLKAVTINSTFSYDEEGKLEESQIQYGTDVTERNNLTYTSIGSSGIFYKVAENTKTKTYGNQPAFEQKQTYTYDNKGNLLMQVDFANTDKPITTTYSNYNSIGIPLTVQTSASGEETSVNTITVDNQGRVLSSTNALGFTSFKTYDPIFGNVLTEKDHLGNIVKYTYDAWGKIVSSISPTGINKYSTTNWATDGNQPTNALYKVTASGDGNPNVITYYDARGRELQIISYNAFNQKIVADKEYDPKGRVAATSEPRFESETPRWTSYTYDDYGRQSTIASPTSTASVSYNGLTINSIVNGRTSSKTLNAIGDVLSAKDAMGNTVSYTYHSSGQPVTITAAGATTTMTYNAKGQQTRLTDPDAGTTRYEYDAFGRLKKQTDARGYEFSMTYDVGSRPLTKICPNNITLNYAYTANGLTDYILSTETGKGYHKQSFSYDSYGRTISVTDEIAAGETYTSSFVYDNFNRVTQKTYPSGYQVKYTYSPYNGELYKVLKLTNDVIWELTEQNSKGTRFKQGTGLFTKNTYSENGFLEGQKTGTTLDAGNIQNFTYIFDEAKGNLMFRSDVINSQSEDFEYDNLDRLRWIIPYTGLNKEIIYAPNGNITYKYDAGTYQYNLPEHPHAVNAVLGNTNIPAFQQTITYNAFGKVATINEDVNNMSIRYGTDQQRIEGKWYNNGTLVKTKKYLGDYEIKIQGGVTNYFHYIYTLSGLTAVIIRTGSTDSLFYVCTDHLGSLTALVTEGGTVVERHSFDAWGRERNPNNWSEYVTSYNRLERGYTMHEHLYTFGLINMNGRVYDPILGRMFSPDNYVQDPFNPQNYNRYGYCLNNPLIYTDPSGNTWRKFGNWLNRNSDNISLAMVSPLFGPGLLMSSDTGYELQKLISPIAVKANFNFGSDMSGIGFDISIGAPTICPIGARVHAGWSYYSRYYDDSYTGFAGRYGYELFAGDGVGDNLSYSVTKCNMKGPELDQSIVKVRYGNPFFNIEYENDYMFGLPGCDNGDRWRTGAAKINVGGFTYGLNIFTGDPGLNKNDRKINLDIGGKYGLYEANANGDDPNEYRAGIGYVGFGPFRVGQNSEKFRNFVQNETLHDNVSRNPHFLVLNREPTFYWSFGTGSGNTLW
ncbi:MAG: hypothetical protein JXQ69_01400 [Paludibacteraceae bacterium]|nr:hypothetical protein [Paludibacteraceae bacterium]MBN2786954.1 hypothetical protein [Paludibacteraceae bacterium]